MEFDANYWHLRTYTEDAYGGIQLIDLKAEKEEILTDKKIKEIYVDENPVSLESVRYKLLQQRTRYIQLVPKQYNWIVG